MPRRCCVPGCRSNYDNTLERVKTFQLPSEKELFDKWVKSIPRKDWNPSKTNVVCIKHFTEDCVITSYSYNYNGEKRTFYYDKPHLKPGSCPTIFSGLPTHLVNRRSVKKRKLKKKYRRNIELNEGNVKPEASKEQITEREDNIEDYPK